MSEEIFPTHPGLRVKELVAERGWSQQVFADKLHVSRVGVNQLLGGKRAISPLMALKLAAVFQDNPQVFLEQQNIYDLHRIYEIHQGEIENIRTACA